VAGSSSASVWLELAGEVADGVILGAIYSPVYLAEVRRRLAAGAACAERDATSARAREQQQALALIGDDTVDQLTICGTPEERQAAMSRVSGEIDAVMLTMPPFRMDETETAARVLAAAVALDSPRHII
jgi:hypothetical protein